MGPPSSTVAAPNIRVPDTIAERTSRMGKPPESEKKNGPEIRAELAAAGCPRDSAIFPGNLTLRRTRRVWVVIGVRLTAERLTPRSAAGRWTFWARFGHASGGRHVPGSGFAIGANA